MVRKYDALVVGYGPTGAVTANLLGQRGWHVLVIDKALTTYDRPRAITADQETMRVLQGIGLAEELEQITVPHPGTDFRGVDGQVIQRFDPAPPPHLLSWNPSFMFVQPELEALLQTGVERFDNVEVSRGHEYRSAVEADSGISATVLDCATGDEYVIEADYLLACDGASSAVRRGVDARFEDLEFDEWWLVVDAWVSPGAELPDKCTHFCRPGRPGSYIVGPGTLRRWEIKILPGENPGDFKESERVRSVLAEFVDLSDIDLHRIAVYRFHALLAERWRFGRTFLLGDAAHQMPPFLGQGLGAGVRDAFNICWKLDGVHRRHYADSVLDTYGVERRPHVGQVVRHAEAFGRIIGELDPVQALRRDEEILALGGGSPRTLVRQDLMPGLECGLVASAEATSAAGQLFPQPWVRVGDQEVRLDDMLGSHFAIVSLHGSQPLSDGLLKEWDSWGGTVLRISSKAHPVGPDIFASSPHVLDVVETGAVLTTWAHRHHVKHVVVRPDRFVYGAARSASELHRLVRQLEVELLGTSRARVTAVTGAGAVSTGPALDRGRSD